MIGPSVGDEITFDAEHADDDWMALGTAEFLRAWVGHPAFRLVKKLRQTRGEVDAVTCNLRQVA
ncbi:DUF6368 family protein [Streptomyces massasporeus]